MTRALSAASRSAHACASFRTMPVRPARNILSTTPFCKTAKSRHGRVSMAGETSQINPDQNAPWRALFARCRGKRRRVCVRPTANRTYRGKLTDASFLVQAKQVLANVEAVLRACGNSVSKLVQVRVRVDDLENWREFDAIYAEWAGSSRPSRAVVPTGRLHYGLKVEVEAIALRTEQKRE